MPNGTAQKALDRERIDVHEEYSGIGRKSLAQPSSS
jgi:hypothetical protein